MLEIAIYGKGGIGKSTMAANISSALSLNNHRVLQIGCDPKHDSTRLLTHGYEVTTVLDYIKETNPTQYQKEDILTYGYNQIGCIEAGGPTPGVGCAGRGIITTFELLDNLNIKSEFDITVYDVLGDVVCGGFAVPIRNEYADVIFIVTSGEYMSLYAANNILRGIENYDKSKNRVAGIIFNKRNIVDEDARLQAFAKAVDLPIIATIPRSDVFAKADEANQTVVEIGLDKDIDHVFAKLANNIDQGLDLYKAKPVSDLELEQLIFKKLKTIPKTKKEVITNQKQQSPQSQNNPNFKYLSKNMVSNEPLHGCAFNGAISMAVHLQDVMIIAHSPKNCTFISYQTISSSGRRGLFERGALLPVSIAPNLESTDMDESDVIFGGMDNLKAKVAQALKQKPKAIVIVSACPAGIIGDDIDEVKQLATKDTPIYTLKTDGNLAGDYLQGMLMAYTELARQIIDKQVEVEKDSVNVVFEKVVNKNTNPNFELIQSYLNQLGIKVNTRFLMQSDYEGLKNFKKASLNLLAFKDYTGIMLQEFFEKEYDSKFFEYAFPIGFDETKNYLQAIAKYFNKEHLVDDLIKQEQAKYAQEIERLKPILKGKKLMVVTYNHEIDWLLKTALDLEMDVVKVGILAYSQDSGFRTKLNYQFNVEEDYDNANRASDIKKYHPDVLISNYANSEDTSVKVMDTMPMCPDVGFSSAISLAKRWATLLQANTQGEWKNDKVLFNKYHRR